MAWINLQGPDPGGIVDGGVLEPLDRFSLGTNEFQELGVNLDVVSRRLLLVPIGWNRSDRTILREAVHFVAPKYLVDPSSGNPGGVIAHQLRDDPRRPEMIIPPEMHDLHFDRDRDPSGQIASRTSFPIDQPRFTTNFEGLLPFVKRVAGDAEVSAGLRDVSRFRGMCEDLEFALNLALGFGYAH